MIYAYSAACVVLTVMIWRWLLADMRRVMTFQEKVPHER